MKVTVDELLEFLHMAKVFNKSHELTERIKAHGIAPPDGYVLVPVEDCDACGNTGKFSKGYMMESISCYCHNTPQSRYNQNKALFSAVKEKDNEQ